MSCHHLLNPFKFLYKTAFHNYLLCFHPSFPFSAHFHSDKKDIKLNSALHAFPCHHLLNPSVNLEILKVGQPFQKWHGIVKLSIIDQQPAVSGKFQLLRRTLNSRLLAKIISLPVETDRWEGLDLVLLGVLGLVDLDKEDVHLVNTTKKYEIWIWNIFVKIIFVVDSPYLFE